MGIQHIQVASTFHIGTLYESSLQFVCRLKKKGSEGWLHEEISEQAEVHLRRPELNAC